MRGAAGEVRKGENPSGFGKDPEPLNLKPRIPALENLGCGKTLQEHGLTIKHAVLPHLTRVPPGHGFKEIAVLLGRDMR